MIQEIELTCDNQKKKKKGKKVFLRGFLNSQITLDWKRLKKTLPYKSISLALITRK